MSSSLYLLLCVCCMFAIVAEGGKVKKKPHIMFIMADDYGWANIGYHSNPQNANEVQTPNLDSLHHSGLELNRHYVHKICSPSRCSFLSGRLPIHVNGYNLERNYNPANNVSGYAGIPINMTLIAQKMKKGGYATHYTGKWDAGFATEYHLPVNRGFDTGYGYLQHANDYWQFTTSCAIDLWVNDAPGIGLTNSLNCSQTMQTGCTYEDDLFVNHVLAELDAHDPNVPLFYYYAPHNVHEPLQAPKSYMDKFAFITDNDNRRTYAAMVNHMDYNIGLVVDKLKAKGMWNNTLLVFASDNGGPLDSANNYPLKGGKESNWEGGIRGNAFIAGGYLPADLRGTVSDDFIYISDWYATFCGFANVDPKDTVAVSAHLPPIDSYDMWPLITKSNLTNPRTEIPLGTDNGGNGNNITMQGIISPPYKLLVGVINKSFWQGPVFPNATKISGNTTMDCGDTGCLYDIIADPTEHNDISKTNHTMAAKLLTRMKSYTKSIFNVDRGASDYQACKTASKSYSGFFGPWVDPIF